MTVTFSLINRTKDVRLAELIDEGELRQQLDHIRSLSLTRGESTWLRIVLCEGKNREIRRMLAKLGHKVLRLKRVAIGPILLDKLPKGKSRKLSLAELEKLRKLVGGKKSVAPPVKITLPPGGNSAATCSRAASIAAAP